MNSKTKILLVGTGAIGGYYGAKLSQSGAEISTLCRSDYSTVKEKGISVTSIQGDLHMTPAHVIKDAAEYPDIPDFIIIATKVLPDINIPEIIQKAVHPHTALVLLQNGIDIETPVLKAFPKNEIISGLAFICVTRTAPGVIDHQDYGRLVIGTYPSGITDKVKLLHSLFTSAGVSCEIDQDIIAARWKKLVWNAPFNPISVLAGGADTKAMLESKPTLNLVQHVMEEVLILAKATGHPLPEEIVKKNIDDTLVMTPYKTSMLNDYESRRPMEVEAILGNAVRIAHEHRISVPHIESLYGILSLADTGNTKKHT